MSSWGERAIRSGTPVELGENHSFFTAKLLLQMLELLAGILEEELAVDHEQNSKEIEEEEQFGANDGLAVQSQDDSSVGCEEAQPVEQEKTNHEKDDNGEQGDIGNH